MKTRFITFLLLFVMNLGVFAQSSYQPAEENLKARREFQDNKFGIFLHWGLYAMLASGEWTMTNNNLNYKEYAKLAGGFYPSKFDADNGWRLLKLREPNISVSLAVITKAFLCLLLSIRIITSQSHPF